MSKRNTVVNVLLLGIVIVTTIIIVFLIIAKTPDTDTASESIHAHGRVTNSTANLENDAIISHSGIHYHPKLNIYIKGQLQTIPPDVGLRPIEHPIHTHDTDNVLHLEFSGLVTVNNTRLQEFFIIWGKQFNSNCIFDKCNGPSGTVKMFVNGQPNTEFEKYPIKGDNLIEIRYE